MQPRSAAPSWAILGLTALLLIAPLASGRPQLQSSTQLREDVAATGEAGVLEFRVVFTMPQEAEAYLKVSPVPGNPVFGNGTMDGEGGDPEGWWTEVVLEDGNGTLYEGTTIGDPPTDFGVLRANTTYTLHLRAHAPAGALARPANYTLDYILAEHKVVTGSGSGGTLDESVGLHAVVRVQGTVAEAAPSGIPTWAWIAGAVAVLALVAAVAVMAVRRRAGQQGPPGPQG